MARTARPPASSRLVTLTSDIGSAYAAQMKAVLVSDGVPPGRIVDLAHDLPAHAVGEAAFLFREMARGFPNDSVHVVVVDPGVGGQRNPVIVSTGRGPILVGPDNGVLYPLAVELGLGSAHRIEVGRLARPGRVGTTFDGRDLFAPAAARLATGSPASALGPPTRLRRFSLPEPTRSRAGAEGEVLHVDRFGNLITNVPTRWAPSSAASAVVGVARSPASSVPFAASYEALGRGRTGLLGSSFGLLEVSVGEGRAADRFRARVGSRVTIRWVAGGPTPGETDNSARPRKRG